MIISFLVFMISFFTMNASEEQMQVNKLIVHGPEQKHIPWKSGSEEINNLLAQGYKHAQEVNQLFRRAQELWAENIFLRIANQDLVKEVDKRDKQVMDAWLMKTKLQALQTEREQLKFDKNAVEIALETKKQELQLMSNIRNQQNVLHMQYLKKCIKEKDEKIANAIELLEKAKGPGVEIKVSLFRYRIGIALLLTIICFLLADKCYNIGSMINLQFS